MGTLARPVHAEKRNEGRLTGVLVFLNGLADGFGIAFDVQNVVGDLERLTQRGPVLAQRFAVGLAQYRPCESGPFEQRPRLARLKRDDFVQSERVRRHLCCEIERLSHHHAESPGTVTERSGEFRAYVAASDRRVTDHRIGLTLHKLDRMMDGDLDEVIDALTADDQARRLAEMT